MKPILEVCVASVASAMAAERGGAARVELAGSLTEGGITPGGGMITLVRRYVSVGMFVMVKPRGGDFCYSDKEFDCMCADILVAGRLGADGVVAGVLLPDGSVDIERTAALVILARPMQFTFHRAFDMTNDPFRALEDIIDTGASRILTSGQKNKAIDGAGLIRELVSLANGRIAVMAGSGITEHNIEQVRRATGAVEFHGSFSKRVESGMVFRREEVMMGGAPQLSEYEIVVTDEERVRGVVAKLEAPI